MLAWFTDAYMHHSTSMIKKTGGSLDYNWYTLTSNKVVHIEKITSTHKLLNCQSPRLMFLSTASHKKFRYGTTCMATKARFIARFIDIVDKHAPEKSRVIVARADAPWYTSELVKEKRLRRKLERKYNKTKLAVDKERFNHQRNIYNHLLTQAKQDYFKTKLKLQKLPKIFIKCVTIS